MEKPLNLTIFYTQNIRGDLKILPRLYTFIQRLKQTYAPDTKPLIFDLGNSCMPDVWPCDVTGGRSTLIVLDGMGYHAANVTETLAEGSREKLVDIMRMAMVDSEHTWHYDIPPITDESIIVTTHPIDTPELRLNICLTGTNTTHIDGKTLYLASVEKKQVGMIQLDLSPQLTIQAHDVFTLEKGTPPNPTIVASVDFVEDEARYYEKNQ